MAAPAARRAAAPVAPPAPAGFNFGNMDAYSSGGGMPEGDYVISSISVQMFAGTKQDGSKAGDERLGALISFHPMAGGEDLENFYSFGSKAHLSWEPDETGKKIVPVIGGPGTPPNRSTNWAMFMQSLYDAGMPQNVVSDDLSVIEGTWVHMQNVPEPAERKGFKAATGEAAVEDKPRTIAIVSEIKEGGAPWEGGGGIPEAPAPKATATPAATRSPAASRPAPAATTAKRAEAASPSDDLDAIASEAVYAVLQANPAGMKKLQLRTSTFKAVTSAGHDASVAQSVVNTYFKSDTALDSILSPLSYTVDKDSVKPLG